MDTVYLAPDVMQALSVYAARRDQSMSLIAEAAIASFLSPDADERKEAAIANGSTSRTVAWRGSSVMSESVSRRWHCSSASGSTPRHRSPNRPPRRPGRRLERATIISSLPLAGV
jgi:predicted transcriptional regulator